MRNSIYVLAKINSWKSLLCVLVLILLFLFGYSLGGENKDASLKHSGPNADKSGFFIVAEKPLVVDDYLIFRFWTANKKYFVRGNPDGHLKWGICGMGDCRSYSYPGDKIKEKFKQSGYEFVNFNYKITLMGEKYSPDQEMGIIVSIKLNDKVLQGNRIQIGTNYSGSGTSHLPFIIIVDEFRSPIATYEISAEYRKEGNDWIPISIELF